MWLFWASFGRIQKNLSNLTDNYPKQGKKVLLFPHHPAATMPKLIISRMIEFILMKIIYPNLNLGILEIYCLISN